MMQKYNPMSAKLCYFGYFSKLQAKKWREIICSCDGAAGNKVTDNFKAQECLAPLENRI